VTHGDSHDMFATAVIVYNVYYFLYYYFTHSTLPNEVLRRTVKYCLSVRSCVSKTLCRNLTKVPVGPTKAVAQWRNCNFWAPGKHAVHSLMTVLIHNSGHFGPPLPFWAPGPPALPGAPMASYANAVARFCSDGDVMYFWFYR